MPLDKQGAKILFTVNPREPKFFPLSLQASAKVFWAAREDWTLASDCGWDLTNYGLFNCNDEQAGRITQNLVDAMARLGCKTLVIGECGHGYGSARWEGPEWLQKTLPVRGEERPGGDGRLSARRPDQGGSVPEQRCPSPCTTPATWCATAASARPSAGCCARR